MALGGGPTNCYPNVGINPMYIPPAPRGRWVWVPDAPVQHPWPTYPTYNPTIVWC